MPRIVSGIQAVSDSFNRADANPLDGSWAKPTDTSIYALRTISDGSGTHTVSAQTSPVTVFNFGYYNGIVWPPDQWSEVTRGVMTSLGTESSYIGAAVRVSAQGDAYYGMVGSDSGSGTAIFIQKLIYHVGFTTLAGPVFTPVPVGAKIRTTVIGSLICCYVDGKFICSATDTSLTSGSAGIEMFVQTSPNRITAWQGGDFGARSGQQGSLARILSPLNASFEVIVVVASPLRVTAHESRTLAGSVTRQIISPQESLGIIYAAARPKQESLAPKLPISSDSLVTFSAKSTDNNPGGRQITVTSQQPGLAYTATSDSPWLTITPTSGVTPQTHTITVDKTALANGVYTGTITLTVS